MARSSRGITTTFHAGCARSSSQGPVWHRLKSVRETPISQAKSSPRRGPRLRCQNRLIQDRLLRHVAGSSAGQSQTVMGAF
ncbi:MAG: hypothetical protein MUO35_08565 [Anaerolineales bacterium]|nr:hypothetical protein [Anaerolineales bacterium]